jgi:hypothetical protein
VKIKVTLQHATKAQWWSRGVSTLSLTSALGGGGGQCYASAALCLGKTWYPLYRRLGGPQGRSGREWKTSPPQGSDPRTVQPLASRYTHYAIMGLLKIIYVIHNQAGGWSMLCPGCFTPGKDPVPIVLKAGWAPGPVWTGVENLTPAGI